MDMQTIADRLALNDLVYAYATAADRRDQALMRSLFTADAEIVVPGFEFDTVDDYIQGLDGLARFKSTLHCVHNHTVTFDDDRGEGECYCIAAHLYEHGGAEWKMDWGIRYLDHYRRCSDGWKFSRRRLIRVWEQRAPLQRE